MERRADQIRAQTSSKNGEISCSVEETNRIRAALGLKPLRVTKPEPAPHKPSKPHQPPSEQIRERIQASRAARHHRRAAIAPRSIAEQALNEDDDDDNLKAWVERSRVRSTPKTPVVDDQLPQGENLTVTGGEKFGAVAEEVDISGGETKTLTLRDVDVTDTRDDVLEDDAAAVASLRKKREEEIHGITYDATDTSQFERGAKKEGPQSVADIPRVVENDYESEAVFRKVKKRSKKRRRRNPVTVVRGTADALRKAADAGMEQENDEDDHYELLRKATAKAAEKNVEGTVSRILKVVEKAERGGDEEMEVGARLVEEEFAQFLGVRDMDETDSEDEDRIRGEKVRESEGGKGSDGDYRDGRDDVKMEDKVPKVAKEVAKPPEATIRPSVETVPETGLETNGMTGIAATLARLRTKGELKHKPPQKGRARDKRFDDDAENGGKKEIKLSYLDEFGNQLTPKEAFRELCHSFHGKGPGQNKREKRLRKMLKAAKKRSMQGDDTPLASAAALKAEIQRLGSAHVVLSGSQAQQVPPTTAGSAVTTAVSDASKE